MDSSHAHNSPGKFVENFTQIPNLLLTYIWFSALPARQIRILLLIARCTYGCRNKRWAHIKPYDLRCIGISPQHARAPLSELIESGVVEQNKKNSRYLRIKEETLRSELATKGMGKETILKAIISTNLHQSYYQRGDLDLPEDGDSDLPNEEGLTSQEGRGEPLPTPEVRISNFQQSAAGKDPLKRPLNTHDKEPGWTQPMKAFKDRKGTIHIPVNPYGYSPLNATEEAALEAWALLERANPGSFQFYLSAASKGLPLSCFQRFSRNISRNPRIKNKGAAFVHMVQEYWREKDYSWAHEGDPKEEDEA